MFDTRRDVSSADAYPTAELAAMIKEQTAALVKEMGKSSKFKKRRTAESNRGGDDEESDDNDDNDDDDDDDDDEPDNRNDEDGDAREDGGPYAWIGKWIQKPKGERCRRTTNRKKGGKRIGFTTAKLLRIAGITREKYSMYKVRLQFPFCRITDSPQKSAHQLIGRYFDISKKFSTNTDNHPDSWALIVEKVRPVHFHSMFLTFLQMKERHPRFRWHGGNWLIEHIAVGHLEAMRRSLKRRDPDLQDLQEYDQLVAEGIVKKRKIRPEPESESESDVSLLIQFTSHVPIDPSPFAQRPRKSIRSTTSAPIRKQTISKHNQVQVLVSTQAFIENISHQHHTSYK